MTGNAIQLEMARKNTPTYTVYIYYIYIYNIHNIYIYIYIHVRVLCIHIYIYIYIYGHMPCYISRGELGSGNHRLQRGELTCKGVLPHKFGFEIFGTPLNNYRIQKRHIKHKR